MTKNQTSSFTGNLSQEPAFVSLKLAFHKIRIAKYSETDKTRSDPKTSPSLLDVKPFFVAYVVIVLHGCASSG